MESTIVRSKEKLKEAVEGNADRIILRGELAEKMITAIKVKKASKWSIGLLATALAAAPFTGGVSLAAAAPIAVLTGIEVVVIIAVAAIGISLILLTLSKYDDIRIRVKSGDKEAEVDLKRKERTKDK